jgi:hypothetical protein
MRATQLLETILYAPVLSLCKPLESTSLSKTGNYTYYRKYQNNVTETCQNRESSKQKLIEREEIPPHSRPSELGVGEYAESEATKNWALLEFFWSLLISLARMRVFPQAC